MSLRKIGNRFYIDLWIPQAKKRIRRSLWTRSKHVALEKYKDKKDELLAEYQRKEIKFNDFCKQYLEYAWSAKPSSVIREEQRLRKIQEFFESLDIIYLNDITPYHLEQLKAKLKGQNLNKNTINQYLQLLRFMFYRAIDWEIYDKTNPLKKVRFFKIMPQIKPLSHAEARKVLEAAKGYIPKPQVSIAGGFL